MGRWADDATRGAAVVGVQPESRELLNLMWSLPVATTEQVQRMVFPHLAAPTGYKRLQRLKRKGLIENVRLPPAVMRGVHTRGTALWYLTPTARTVAGAIWGRDDQVPLPLAQPTTPERAAQAWAAAAVSEWIAGCRESGLTFDIEPPGPDLYWPGAERTQARKPPLLIARLGAEVVAVDYMLPGRVLPASRRAQYDQALSARQATATRLLVVGWGARSTDLDPVFVRSPEAAVTWAGEVFRWSPM